jgi:hypothetical protein
MGKRFVVVLMMAFAFAVVVGTTAVAQEKAGTHEGTVVKVDGEKLTMSDKDKKEHSHTVPKDAKVTRDGKEAKIGDLKKGDKVTVTVEKKGDKNVITKVEAKSK